MRTVLTWHAAKGGRGPADYYSGSFYFGNLGETGYLLLQKQAGNIWSISWVVHNPMHPGHGLTHSYIGQASTLAEAKIYATALLPELMGK